MLYTAWVVQYLKHSLSRKEQRWTTETDSAYFPTPSLSHKTPKPKTQISGELWRLTIQHLLTYIAKFACVLCFNKSVCDSDTGLMTKECKWGLIASGKCTSAIWLKCKDALSALSSKRSTAAPLILPVRVWQPYSWVSALHPIYFHHCVHDLSRKRATAANLGEQTCIGGWSAGFKQEQAGRPS